MSTQSRSLLNTSFPQSNQHKSFSSGKAAHVHEISFCWETFRRVLLGYSKSHCEIQEGARRMIQAKFIALCSSLWQDVFPFQAFTVLGCEAHPFLVLGCHPGIWGNDSDISPLYQNKSRICSLFLPPCSIFHRQGQRVDVTCITHLREHGLRHATGRSGGIQTPLQHTCP